MTCRIIHLGFPNQIVIPKQETCTGFVQVFRRHVYMEENMGVRMASKKIVPFSWYPYTWGMAGKTREVAKAEYELAGYDLDSRLLEINKDQHDSTEYNRKELELLRKYGKISDDKYFYALAELIEDTTQRSLTILDLDFKTGKITDLEHSKQTATLKGEPWVTVLSMDFAKKTSLEGSFELDWNEFFVKKLEAEGYTAPTADLIVNQWFMEVCRNVAMEEFDGTGDFAADSEANLETVKRWGAESETLIKGRKGYK